MIFDDGLIPIRHIAIMNVRSSRFNLRPAAQSIEINIQMNLSLQSDGSLKRPVPALFRGQLNFDGFAHGMLTLCGEFVFIGHTPS